MKALMSLKKYFQNSKIFLKPYLLGFWMLLLNSCLEERSLNVIDKTNSSIASTIVFSQQPSSGIAASVLSQQPKISILDSSGKKLISGPDAWAQINLAVTNGNGNIIGTHSTYAVLGEAIFTDIAIDQTGLKSLTATKVDMSAYGGSKSITAESSNFLISAGNGTKLVYSAPAFFDAGLCISSTIAIADGGNNLVSATTSINIDISNPGVGSFYSDANCSTAVSSTTILTNSTSRTIYYRNFAQESLNVIFTDPLSQYASTSYQSYVKPANFNQVLVKDTGNGSYICNLYDLGFVGCRSFTIGFGGGEVINRYSYASAVSQTAFSEASQRCHLLANGTATCDNGNTWLSIPGTITSIAVGIDHKCALSTSGTIQSLYCWGQNNNRQLGDGTTVARVNPTLINLGLNPGVSINKILITTHTASSNKNFAVLSSGELIIWGGAGSTNYNPKFINGVNNVKDVQNIAGDNEIYVLLNDGTIQMFSVNYASVVGNTINTFAAPATLPGFANIQQFAVNDLGQVCGFDTSHRLFCYGPRSTQTGSLVNKSTATQEFDFLVDSISSGYFETCALIKNDHTKAICWKDTTIRIEPTFTPLTSTVEKIKLTATSDSPILYPFQCKQITLGYYYNEIIKLSPTDLQIQLVDQSNQGQFYSDANCSQAITTKTIPTSVSQRYIYYKTNTSYSSPKYIFLDGKPLTSGTATGHLTLVLTGDATQMNHAAGPIAANVCGPVVIKAYDQNYNSTYFSKTASTTLNFSLTSGNGKVYSDATCLTEVNSIDVSALADQATVYVKFFDSCGGSNFNISASGLTSGSISASEDCGCD